MKYFFILILCSSSSSYAWQIRLDRTNHSGFRKVDILELEQGEYIFDGKKLGKKLPANVLKSWKDLEKGPLKSVKRRSLCSAGYFIYTNNDEKKKYYREGCTEGEAYGRMIQNIENLRAYAEGI